MHDWMGKVIHRKLCKKLMFYYTNGRPSGSCAGWLKLFEDLISWSRPARFCQLCKVEFISRRLRHPIRGNPTGISIFYTCHLFRFVCGPHYKMILCCILAWWEIGYIPKNSIFPHQNLSLKINRKIFSETLRYKWITHTRPNNQAKWIPPILDRRPDRAKWIRSCCRKDQT